MAWLRPRRARSSSASGQKKAMSLSRVRPRSPAQASMASRASRRGWEAAPATGRPSSVTDSLPNVLMYNNLRLVIRG